MATDPVSAFIAGFQAVNQYETNKQMRQFASEEQSYLRKVWANQEKQWARDELKYMQGQRREMFEAHASELMRDLKLKSEAERDKFLETGGTLTIDGKEETFEPGDEWAAEYVQTQWLNKWYGDDAEETFFNEVLRRWGQAEPEALEHLLLSFGRNPTAGSLVSSRNPVANVGIFALPGQPIRLWAEYNRKDGGTGPATVFRTDSPNDPIDFMTANSSALVNFFGPEYRFMQTPMIMRLKEQVDAQEAGFGPRSPTADEIDKKYAERNKGGSGGTASSETVTIVGTTGKPSTIRVSDLPEGITPEQAATMTYAELFPDSPSAKAPTQKGLASAADKITANIDATDEQILAGRTPSPYAPTEFDTDYFQSGSSYQDALTGSPGVVRSGRWEFAPHKLANKLARPGPEDYLQDPMAVNVYPQDFKDDVDTSGGKKSAYGTGHPPTLRTAEEKAAAVNKGRKPELATQAPAVTTPTSAAEVPKDSDVTREEAKKGNTGNAPAATEQDAPAKAGQVVNASRSKRRVPFRHELYNAASLVKGKYMTEEDFMTFARTGSLPSDVETRLIQLQNDRIAITRTDAAGNVDFQIADLSGGGTGMASVQEQRRAYDLLKARTDLLYKDNPRGQADFIGALEEAYNYLGLPGNTSEELALRANPTNLNLLQNGAELLRRFDEDQIQTFDLPWPFDTEYEPRMTAGNLALASVLGSRYAPGSDEAAYALRDYGETLRPHVASDAELVNRAKEHTVAIDEYRRKGGKEPLVVNGKVLDVSPSDDDRTIRLKIFEALTKG